MSRTNERGERLGTFALFTYKPDGRPSPNPSVYSTREEAERQGDRYIERHPNAPRAKTKAAFGRKYFVRDLLTFDMNTEERMPLHLGRGG